MNPVDKLSANSPMSALQAAWNAADAEGDEDRLTVIEGLIAERLAAAGPSTVVRTVCPITTAEVEQVVATEPERPAPPKAVTTFEAGRWIKREGTPRRWRRPLKRRRGAGRPARRTRARRAGCRRRRSGSTRSGDPPDTGEGESEDDLAGGGL